PAARAWCTPRPATPAARSAPRARAAPSSRRHYRPAATPPAAPAARTTRECPPSAWPFYKVEVSPARVKGDPGRAFGHNLWPGRPGHRRMGHPGTDRWVTSQRRSHLCPVKQVSLGILSLFLLAGGCRPDNAADTGGSTPTPTPPSQPGGPRPPSTPPNTPPSPEGNPGTATPPATTPPATSPPATTPPGTTPPATPPPIDTPPTPPNGMTAGEVPAT